MRPVAVFAVGNCSRGDDAVGPLLLERLGSWLAAAGNAAEFVLIEDYQLQIEHALDLRAKRMALFIDAGCATPAPVEFFAIGAAPDLRAPSTHLLPPAAVLGVYRQVLGEAPPPSFVLCVRGERFELGAGLSAIAAANLEVAWQQLIRLCARPELQHWQALDATRSC